MLRPVCAIVVLLALGGSATRNKSEVADQRSFAVAPAPARMMMAGKRVAAPPRRPKKLAYSHDLSIETKADTVKQRFEQARDACLNQVIVPGCVPAPRGHCRAGVQPRPPSRGDAVGAAASRGRRAIRANRAETLAWRADRRLGGAVPFHLSRGPDGQVIADGDRAPGPTDRTIATAPGPNWRSGRTPRWTT